jgi:prophage regulatory protein
VSQNVIPPARASTLPATGYVRQSQLIRDPRRPDVAPIVPISAATLWRMVRAGSFPKPVKLTERITAWPVDAISQWLESREVIL